jgi:hypothetical protein
MKIKQILYHYLYLHTTNYKLHTTHSLSANKTFLLLESME